MLKNILNSRVFKVSNSLRSAKLKEYLCIRESFNPESRKSSSQAFQALSKQYSLNSEQLMSLITLLRWNPSGYKNYLSYSEFAEKSEEWQRQYRFSGFFSAKETLEERQRNLTLQYPEVVKYMNAPSERLNGVKTLEKIIFEGGATVEEKLHSGPEGLKEIQRQLKGHIKDFNDEKMQETIEAIIKEAKSNYRSFLINAKVFLETFEKKELSTVQSKEVSQTPKNKEKLLQSKENDPDVLNGLSIKDVEELDNIERIEFQRFVEESNQHQNSVALARWVNDRKLVFEAPSTDYEKLIRNGLLLGGAGLLAVGAFLFILYEGDGRYVTLLTLPALGLLAFTKGSKNLRTLKPSYLQRIWIHRDGKNMDLETISHRGVVLHKDIAIKNFKVYKEGNASVNVENTFLEKGEINETLDSLRRQNLLLHPSFYFETKELNGFIPVGNDHQKFVWEKILRGVEFDTKQV